MAPPVAKMGEYAHEQAETARRIAPGPLRVAQS